MLLPWTRNPYDRVKVYQGELALCLNTCLGGLISSDICVPSPSISPALFHFTFPTGNSVTTSVSQMKKPRIIGLKARPSQVTQPAARLQSQGHFFDH